MKHYLRVAGILILALYPAAALGLIACWLGTGRMPEPLWQWLLFPFIIIAGWIVIGGAMFLVVSLRFGFPNLYEAVKGSAGAAISAPFKFLEAKAKEFERKGDRRTAEFYRKFTAFLFYFSFFGALLLFGLISNWLGIDLGEGE
jgi:hypothetical protein